MPATLKLCILAACAASSTLMAAAPQPAPPPASVSASSQASPTDDGKYGVQRAFDRNPSTHWASANNALPQTITATWEQPVTFDTILIDIFGSEVSHLYASWKHCRIVLDNGTQVHRQFDAAEDLFFVRFDTPQTCSRAAIEILEVIEQKTYVGIDEIGFYSDPGKQLGPPRQLAKPIDIEDIRPRGRPVHPSVYVTPEGVERARRNAAESDWGKAEKAVILKAASPWLERSENEWLAFLPEPGAAYAYGFTGCPICGARFGTWGGARCSWDNPRKVTCAKEHVLPNEDYPDDGTGYRADDGRDHFLLGIWNAWVTEQWTRQAIPALAHAYALTGEEQYAERAAFFLDALASIYPESTSGSWDYPSRPPSGRFARPWYQVARNLVVFVEAYDLIYASDALNKLSMRPEIEKSFPDGPTAQQRAVGTKDASGWSEPNMTRRQNIDRNLMIDGGHYCYRMTFKGGLHNGAADYSRGALAVGALLGIDAYVENAIHSPYSIYAMLANNADRDGRYYETALGYALHARNLYLTFVKPLLHWRSAAYPEGINLFSNERMCSFYILPALSMDCAGHSPNFGDMGPDNHLRFQPERPFSRRDLEYAEWLYAYAEGNTRTAARQLLEYLANGDIEQARKNAGNRRWLLYRAEAIPGEDGDDLPDELGARLFDSWVMGQKGIGILRDGRGIDAQAALLRFGPSLNHGDKDDLGLIYYGKGWQLTYEIGYGLGSTHTQVGWGSQTVSHSLVTVDESSQEGGSGGSLCLFADLPPVKWMEAESHLSYAARDVTQYRRTIALIGQGRDQVLVDLFRVRGGQQHDYTVGVQTQNYATHNIELGPEQEGSLAGPAIAWGEAIGLDGDIKGYPNKPYWNPPPGNGYGFFYDPREGQTNSPFHVEFDLGGRNNTRFRVHALPEADTSAIVAKAPGLYPHNSDGAYLMLRRKQQQAPMQSAFVTVMEPYAKQVSTDGITGALLHGAIEDANARTKYISTYDIVFLGGEQEGDYVTFRLPVTDPGTYLIQASLLKSPSYGSVRLLLNGTQLGKTQNTKADSISGPERITFGTVTLPAGNHSVRFECGPGEQHYLGIAGLIMRPADQDPVEDAEDAEPVVSLAERVPVEGPSQYMTPIGVHLRRNNRDEYLFSASPEDDAVRTAAIEQKTVSWKGALLYLAFRNGELQEAATLAAADLTVGNQHLGPDLARAQATVVNIDYKNNTVDVDTALTSQHLGNIVLFRNPRYSRDTAYRIAAITRLDNGHSRIDLGTQPMLLGQGRVHQIPNSTTIHTDVPHDYARSVIGGNDVGFFNGKLLRSAEGAQTTIGKIVYGQPMIVSVDDADPFKEGDAMFYYDVRIGDQALIPTTWSMNSKP